MSAADRLHYELMTLGSQHRIVLVIGRIAILVLEIARISRASRGETQT